MCLRSILIEMRDEAVRVGDGVMGRSSLSRWLSTCYKIHKQARLDGREKVRHTVNTCMLAEGKIKQ
jgi:hypothetical protein